MRSSGVVTFIDAFAKLRKAAVSFVSHQRTEFYNILFGGVLLKSVKKIEVWLQSNIVTGTLPEDLLTTTLALLPSRALENNLYLSVEIRLISS
jgi:hypothetical protein